MKWKKHLLTVLIAMSTLLVSGCGLNEWLSSLSFPTISSSGSSVPITTTSLCSGLPSGSSGNTTSHVSIATLSLAPSSIYQSVEPSVFLMNACYVQSSQEYYYTTSGFLHSSVDNGDGTTTYYLLSSASGIFHYYQLQGEVLSMKEQGVFEFVFRNGSRYLGEYVGSYDAFDVAVFALTTEDVLSLPTIGSSDDLLVGQAVYAIGTPAFDVSLINTYVGGVVSGLHRRQYVYFNDTAYSLADYSVFQFDAPINGGMEGGAVVNTNGEIVGMLSYKYVDDTSDVTFESIAMAVGMDDIARVIDQIIATGTYARPTIGITIMDVALLSSQDRLANGIYASLYEGVMVSTVASGTAASRAGMVAGEVVVAFNSQEVTNIASLASYLVRTIAGESITLTTVNSLGITKNYTVQL